MTSDRPTHIATLYNGPDHPESPCFIWDKGRDEDGTWYEISDSLDGDKWVEYAQLTHIKPYQG